MPHFTVSPPSWWGGTTCDTGNYPASHPLGASWDGLVACGPGPNAGGTDHLAHFFNGAWGELDWECVELAMRWMYLAWGVHPYPANGDQVAANYATYKSTYNPNGPNLQYVSNGTTGVAPVPGDVLSYSSVHTSVVTASTVNGSGNGTLTVIEENVGTGDGWGTLTVSGWQVSGTVTGWLHNPAWSSGVSSHGYWLVAGDGGVFTFGQVHFYGSTGSMHLQRPVVGMTPAPDQGGYWMVATDGGMFAFGDAKFHGSIPGLGLAPAGSGAPKELNAPIVAMVASPDGQGYLLVAQDGGVFAFGDARFWGSCPQIGGCSGSVVAVVPDQGEAGYWVVTSSGHVYAFGDATNLGSSVSTPALITGAVASASGHGYLLVNAIGDVYGFGDAHPLGAPPIGRPAAIVGIVADSTGGGYWLTGATGAVYPYGDAPDDGSMLGKALNAPIVTAAGF
jgi:hypothetical protein